MSPSPDVPANESRITLMIMINAIVLTHSLTEKEPIRRSRSSALVSDDSNYIRHLCSKNSRRSGHRVKCDGNLDLAPIVIKLKNVFDYYQLKLRQLKALYAPVKPCVPDKCGKTRNVIPKNLLPRRFRCHKFKSCKRWKKEVYKTLSRFQAGVQHFTARFENLTVFLSKKDRKSRISNLKILTKIKINLKMLNEEIETITAKKRLKYFRKQKRLTTLPPQSDTNSNHIFLLINEWFTFQNSMKFLDAWQKSLTDMFTC